MTRIDSWLTQATRDLARDSAAQVRTEIQDHYESARDAAVAGGATSDEADAIAVKSLGDAKVANCQYRRVLLTSSETRMLREGNWEVRAICANQWFKRLLQALPGAAVTAAIALFLTGRVAVARDVLICGIAMTPLFVAPLLPIYTRFRSRVFRCIKWIAMIGALVLIFGPDTLEWAWLLIPCLWPLAWTEWMRTSIRRKLPISAWPKHLYL